MEGVDLSMLTSYSSVNIMRGDSFRHRKGPSGHNINS